MKVLVLNASALHLGYLGCYGNEWVATPALNRLAAEGVVFDQHYADAPGTPRSSWTGRYRFPAPSEAASGEPPPELPALLQTHGVPFVLVGPAATVPEEETTVLERTLQAALDAMEHL